MTNAITDSLYEYKKEHPLGDILLFDGHIDVLQNSHVIEIRQALAFALDGVLELNDPMVMLRTQGRFLRNKQYEQNSPSLRARWATDTLNEFGSDLDGHVLIHTGFSYSDEDFIRDISRDVSNIVRVQTSRNVAEPSLQGDKLYIPAQDSLSKEDIDRVCLGESVEGVEEHLAADVIKSLPLESIVAIKNIVGTKTRREVLELVKHAIDDPWGGNILLIVLREICCNNRQDLLPDLMEIAKSTTETGIQHQMLKCCTKLYPSSFVESYVDLDADIPIDDEYSRRYLREFQKYGGDSFIRKEKGGIPCAASEEIFVDQLIDGHIAFLVEDRPEKPKAVWIFKEDRCGHIDSEYDVLLNLATGELYSPNDSLSIFLSKLNSTKSGEAIRMQTVEASVNNHINFYRLSYCVTGNVDEYYAKKLMKLRKEILDKYVPID